MSNEIRKYTNERIPSFWDLINSIDREFMPIPLDTVFDKWFNKQFPSTVKEMGLNQPFSAQSYPKINMVDGEKQYEITAELAGLNQKDISVDIDPETNVLTIAGKKTKSEEKTDKKYIIRELKESAFSRPVYLGDKCDLNTCKADFKDGILKITIDKKVEEKPKNTKIKVM